MNVTRFEDAPTYVAPKHFDMRSLRLQGLEASDAEFAWLGMSHFLPGGGAEMDAGPLEKIYVVVEGDVTIVTGDGVETTLSKFDSCFIPAGESREIINKSNTVASMMVIMPPAKMSR